MLYPFEETFIEAKVLNGDSQLARAHPHLVVRGEYDNAVLEHGPILLLLRDVLVLASLASAGMITWIAWRG